MPGPDLNAPLDPGVVREAANWLVRLHSGAAGEADHQAFARWRQARPEHEQAWQRAERLSRKFGAVAPELGVPVLTRPTSQPRGNRRAILKTLATLGVALPAGWFGYRAARGEADGVYRAGVGEQRPVLLADRSAVRLNTATDIAVRYSESTRLVELERGEIYIETARDTSGQARPFMVDTAHGRLRALGTRFTVRALDGIGGRTLLNVLEHRVEVVLRDSGARRIVEAGDSVLFSARAFEDIEPARLPSSAAPAWTRGMLEADAMRLDAFLRELSRFRPGIIRCAPEVASLRVSGVFRIDDTDHVLEVIGQTLPVRIVRRTAYWVTVTSQTG
jgi:transmembrane sensor